MGGRNNGNGYNQAKKIFQEMMEGQKPKKRQPNDNRNNWPQNTNNGSINNKK